MNIMVFCYMHVCKFLYKFLFKVLIVVAAFTASDLFATDAPAIDTQAVEWNRNPSLKLSEGVWESGVRLWNFTGGADGIAPAPNSNAWSGDGNVHFVAQDTRPDIFGAVSSLRQINPALDLATVASLHYELTISSAFVSNTLTGWTGIAVPAHLRLKGQDSNHDDLYLEIYLDGKGLNHPLAWAIMPPFGDGNRALKAVGYFPGIASDHYMIRAPATEHASTTINADGSTTFRIDVAAIAAEAIAVYNQPPYNRNINFDNLELHMTETFAEAGYLGPPWLASLFGLPRSNFTLQRFSVLYTLRDTSQVE